MTPVGTTRRLLLFLLGKSKSCTIFTYKQPQHNALENAVKKLRVPSKRLHKQCETVFPGLLLALERLSDGERNAETRSEVKSLLSFIGSMDLGTITASVKDKSILKALNEKRTDEHFKTLIISTLKVVEEARNF